MWLMLHSLQDQWVTIPVADIPVVNSWTEMFRSNSTLGSSMPAQKVALSPSLMSVSPPASDTLTTD